MQTILKLSVLLAFCLVCRQVQAQHYLEVRGASTEYRYFDWNYTFSNSIVLDTFYVGVPGSNEFNLGGGYALKPSPSLTITPLVYAVIGKEGGQRGIKLAVLAALDKDGWRLNAFLGQYARLSGEVGGYQVLDTLDVSRVVCRRWEIGMSGGFFHADREWNPQVGPLIKFNDHLGAWSVSYRFGPQNEFRAGRTFLLKK